MIEQVIEARAAKEGVDHIIFAPRVVTHPKKQLSDQEQAFCQAYWELAELRLSGIHPLVVAIGGIARKLGGGGSD